MDSELYKFLISTTEYSEKINKNDFFIKTGQPNRKIGIVKNGLFRAYVIDENGDEVNIFFYKENDLVSGNFVPDLPAPTNIQAIEDSEIVYSDFSKVLQTINNNNTLRTKFYEKVDLFHSKIQLRLTSFINLNSYERYKSFLDEYPNLINRIPNYYIASYLGITPTQLSRIKKTYVQK